MLEYKFLLIHVCVYEWCRNRALTRNTKEKKWAEFYPTNAQKALLFYEPSCCRLDLDVAWTMLPKLGLIRQLPSTKGNTIISVQHFAHLRWRTCRGPADNQSLSSIKECLGTSHAEHDFAYIVTPNENFAQTASALVILPFFGIGELDKMNLLV